MSSLLAEVIAGHGFAVQTAKDVAEARRAIRDFDPDILVLDVALGEGPTGLHLAHATRLSRPDIAILIFTSQDDITRATSDGLAVPPGVGFLRKHLVSDQAYLIEAMERVLHEQEEAPPEREPTSDAFAFLGSNGSRTLRLLAEGFDNEEIARRCGMSRKSVERWIEQLYRDLGIDTKGALNPRVAAARRYLLTVGVPSAIE